MYYPCSENKGADQLRGNADQLRGYREADLRLCFRICKKTVFSRRGSHVFAVKYKCGKLSTVESIAIQHHVDQKNATLCGTSNRQGSDESFVLVNCDTPNPSEWKQGINVCNNHIIRGENFFRVS